MNETAGSCAIVCQSPMAKELPHLRNMSNNDCTKQRMHAHNANNSFTPLPCADKYNICYYA